MNSVYPGGKYFRSELYKVQTDACMASLTANAISQDPARRGSIQ